MPSKQQALNKCPFVSLLLRHTVTHLKSTAWQTYPCVHTYATATVSRWWMFLAPWWLSWAPPPNTCSQWWLLVWAWELQARRMLALPSLELLCLVLWLHKAPGTYPSWSCVAESFLNFCLISWHLHRQQLLLNMSWGFCLFFNEKPPRKDQWLPLDLAA